MIIKHAQHFLTDEGKLFFKEWVQDLQVIAAKYPGFDAVWPMASGDRKEEIHLFMIFSDEIAYQRWISAEEHTKILDKLTRYQLKPWQAKSYASETSPVFK